MEEGIRSFRAGVKEAGGKDIDGPLGQFMEWKDDAGSDGSADESDDQDGDGLSSPESDDEDEDWDWN